MTAYALKHDQFPTTGARQSLAMTYQRLMLVMLLFAGVTALIAGRLL